MAIQTNPLPFISISISIEVDALKPRWLIHLVTGMEKLSKAICEKYGWFGCRALRHTLLREKAAAPYTPAAFLG